MTQISTLKLQETLSGPGLPIEMVDGMAYEIQSADTYSATFTLHPEGFDEILFQLNGQTVAAFAKADFLAMCATAIEHFK